MKQKSTRTERLLMAFISDNQKKFEKELQGLSNKELVTLYMELLKQVYPIIK